MSSFSLVPPEPKRTVGSPSTTSVLMPPCCISRTILIRVARKYRKNKAFQCLWIKKCWKFKGLSLTHHNVFTSVHYAIDCAPQAIQVDRLGEVLNEARLVAAADVFFHSVAGEGDSPDREFGEQLTHEIVAGSVGQAEVADEQVESLGLRDL